MKDDEIKYLVGSTSVYKTKDFINNHYDECYLITKDIDISKLKLQKEEVSEVKYFPREELLKRIDNDYDGLTKKTVSWHFMKKILENQATN